MSNYVQKAVSKKGPKRDRKGPEKGPKRGPKKGAGKVNAIESGPWLAVSYCCDVGDDTDVGGPDGAKDDEEEDSGCKLLAADRYLREGYSGNLVM